MSLKKFYDREAEQSFLVEEASLSQSLKSARLVVVTGRRRVGKTELLLRSLSKSGEVAFIYLFATRLTARALISEWVRSIASVIDMPFLPQFDRLSQVVEYLLYVARTRPIHVAIDECQDLNVIEPSFWCDYGYNIRIGKNFYANHNLILLDAGGITFGSDVFVGPNCGFYTSSHPLDYHIRNQGLEDAKPITVGSNVWFGGNVTVLPGVTIGDNVVIGAGSVVTHDIPSDSIAVGNPCRVIRTL